MRLAKRVLAVSVVAVSLAMLLPSSLATASSGTECWNYRQRDLAFARKINAARSARGIHKLVLDRHLSKVARRHSTEMKRASRLYHTPSRALRRRVTRWVMLGENVGVGGDVDQLHVAFMKSEGHRHNVLHRSFRYVGVGTRRRDGRLWVTIIFESRLNPGTRLRMPTC